MFRRTEMSFSDECAYMQFGIDEGIVLWPLSVDQELFLNKLVKMRVWLSENVVYK